MANDSSSSSKNDTSRSTSSNVDSIDRNSSTTAIDTIEDEDANADVGEEEEEEEEEDLVIPESSAYWSKEPYSWTTSLQHHSLPMLTSSACTHSLYKLFHNTYYEAIDSNGESNNNNNDNDDTPNYLLSVLVESSSHPSGLDALFAQPYLYAGPGLGNIDECPLQTCLAGGNSQDSLTFASVCITPECSAFDLASHDFVAVVQRQWMSTITTHSINGFDDATTNNNDLGHDYVNLLQRISDINEFLKTGWTCGNFVVPWSTFGGPSYLILCVILLGLSWYGSRTTAAANNSHSNHSNSHPQQRNAATKRMGTSTTCTRNDDCIGNDNGDDDKEQEEAQTTCTTQETSSLLPSRDSSSSSHSSFHTAALHHDNKPWYHAFDARVHLTTLLVENSRPTSILDGLRVMSMLWIMLGHCMAIQSSMGAGYANPANFLPPTGLTTTLPGQLLFSSRLAVDTFLIVSGFLAVFVLVQKLPWTAATTSHGTAVATTSVLRRYLAQLPRLVLTRVVRILPVYFMCIGFYTQVAPHLGGGPFWHQWIALLQPCHDWAWTNLLFINNFVPFDTPTISTCFYHSWYLAVDMQLFVLLAPLLVFGYQAHKTSGKYVTLALFGLSVAVTAYLTFVRRWSLNTLDGAAVDRYDMEAYAKPHVRAQSYLAGMLAAMVLLDEQERSLERFGTWRRSRYGMRHSVVVGVCILAMCLVSFVTVTGAYAQRPCTYGEDAFVDACGSADWPAFGTLLYTAFSRTVWVVAVAVLIYVCVGRGHESWLASMLSWRCWTPLSQLSFGAYLIHPIVIFVWKLADREKDTFRLQTFGMDFLSVCVVSYVSALIAAVVVEFPCATMWKRAISKSHATNSSSPPCQRKNGCDSKTTVEYGAILYVTPATSKQLV